MTLAARLRGRRVGVALSSAFFGFYAHTGFMRALQQAGVRPAALGGTSAGAMVAAFAAAGDVDDFVGVLSALRRRDFWDPAWSLRGRPRGLLRGGRFADLLARHLPADRFEACHTPLLTVSTNLTRRERHVDTAGELVPAVHASCALPLLFHPVERGGEQHIDGGLLDKVPVRAMLEAFELDALLVHMIPSSGLSAPTARSPWGFLDQALDLVRHDGWEHQAELARARGVEVHVVTTSTPRPHPFALARGAAAIREAEAQTLAALSSG